MGGGAKVLPRLFVYLVHIKHNFMWGGAQVFLLMSICVHIKHDFVWGGTSFPFVCPFGSH